MNDPLVRKALDAGGHLADDVAEVVLAHEQRVDGLARDIAAAYGKSMEEASAAVKSALRPTRALADLADTLVSDDPALD